MEYEDQDAPELPCLETWSFRVRIVGDGTPDAPNTAIAIRQQVIRYLSGDHSKESKRPNEDLEQNWNTVSVIRLEIEELVATRLSGPGNIYYVTDYEESEGSFIISFSVLAAVYHGIAHYGEFREGLDRIVEDLRALFGGIKGVVARVGKRFKTRQPLPARRKEPKIDWGKVKDDDPNSKEE